MAYILLEDAKAHLRVTDDNENADVQRKLTQSEAIILDYLKSQADPAWDETTVPGQVVSATLLMLSHLYEHRGDDQKSDADLWESIRRLLERSRDPAFA